mgnify:CR=1 FL=1
MAVANLGSYPGADFASDDEATRERAFAEMTATIDLSWSTRGSEGIRVDHDGPADQIEVARDDWILDFDGRSLGDPTDAGWAVKKDGGAFDQFSGATITPPGKPTYMMKCFSNGPARLCSGPCPP